MEGEAQGENLIFLPAFMRSILFTGTKRSNPYFNEMCGAGTGVGP